MKIYRRFTSLSRFWAGHNDFSKKVSIPFNQVIYSRNAFQNISHFSSSFCCINSLGRRGSPVKQSLQDEQTVQACAEGGNTIRPTIGSSTCRAVRSRCIATPSVAGEDFPLSRLTPRRGAGQFQGKGVPRTQSFRQPSPPKVRARAKQQTQPFQRNQDGEEVSDFASMP